MKDARRISFRRSEESAEALDALINGEDNEYDMTDMQDKKKNGNIMDTDIY